MKRDISIVKLVPCVFAIMTLPLFFMSLFGFYYRGAFINTLGESGVIFLLMLCSAMLFVSIVVSFLAINRLREGSLKYLCLFLFAVMAGLMAFFITNFHSLHVADQWVMLDEARYLALNPGQIIDSNNLYTEYYGRYGNNYFLTIVFMYVYRIVNALHVADEYLVLVIINALCVYLSDVLLFLCVRTARGMRDATKALLFLTLNPINYSLLLWVYSCTISTPLLVAGVYLGLLAYREESTVRKLVYAFLSGLNGALAYYIRPTSMIPLIACALLAFFFVIRNFRRIKTVAPQMAVCVLTLLLMMKIVPFTYKPYVDEQQFDQNFPLTHWVMMSSYGRGVYDYDALLFTQQFETKEEKQQQTLDKAIENYRALGVSGTVRLFVDKAGISFSDGISYGPSRLEQDSYYTRAYSYFAGDRNDFFTIYSQSFRVVALLFMTIAGFLVYKSRKIIPDIYLMMTTVMGGYLFYCLWEAKSVYSAPFLPCMLACASLGCSMLVDRLEAMPAPSRTTLLKTSRIALAGALAFAFVIMYATMAKTNYERRDYVRRNTITKNQLASIVGMQDAGDTIMQEVAIDRPINRIDLIASTGEGTEEKPTTYRLDICDAAGTVLASKDFTSAQAQAQDMVMPVEVPYDPAVSGENCLVKVTLVEPGSNPLVFKYRKSSSIDVFPGRAFVNDVEAPYDVEMSVFYTHQVPYLRPRWCLVLYALIVVHMIILDIMARRCLGRHQHREPTPRHVEG